MASSYLNHVRTSIQSKVMIVLWLMCLLSFIRFSEERTVKNLVSSVQWYPSTMSRRPGNDMLPYRIDLTLNFRSVTQLNLIREEDNIESVRVYTKIKVNPNSQHLALYRDRTKYATFSVGMEGNKVTYYGEFVYNDVVWSLMPEIGDRTEYKGSNDNIYQIKPNGTIHYVRKEKVHAGQPTEDVAVKPPKYDKNTSMVNPVDSEARRQNPVYLPDGRQLYTVEIFVVLDYSVYKKWYDNSGKNKDKTIANLKQFYAHVINGVKERYEGMVMHGIKYTASLAGYHIITTIGKSDFIENTRAPGSYSIESYQALKNIVAWVTKKLNEFPQFDVGAVFTSYGLLPHYNGLANIGAACTVRGMSINRDMGSWDTIFTVTHEIGHNLGSPHDSEGNNCKNEDQYIMAKGKFLTKGNFFNFSECSVRHFQDYNRFLYEKKTMCLHNQPESVFPKGTDEYLNQHPGQKLTLDQQCRAIFGSGSGFCGADFEESICMRLNCIVSTGICTEAAAAEGTSCGDGKWCHRAECVKDNRAPAMKKTCPFGDYKVQFEYDKRQYTCSDLISKISSLCYENYYRLQCCDSCQKLRKKLKNKECPYGNKRSDCVYANCYDFDYAQSCCETCKSVKFHANRTLMEVCENEILDSRCHTVDSRRCYKLNKICCTRCKAFKTDIKDCEYGDKGSWCEKRVRETPDDCSYISADCCGSCHEVLQNGTKKGKGKSKKSK